MFFFTHNSYVIYKCDLWIIRVKNVNHMICSRVFFFTCWLIYFNVIFWVFFKKIFLQHIIDLLGKIWIKWIIWFIHVILFNVIRLFSHVTYFYIWFLSYLKCESYNSFTFVCCFFYPDDSLFSCDFCLHMILFLFKIWITWIIWFIPIWIIDLFFTNDSFLFPLFSFHTCLCRTWFISFYVIAYHSHYVTRAYLSSRVQCHAWNDHMLKTHHHVWFFFLKWFLISAWDSDLR